MCDCIDKVRTELKEKFETFLKTKPKAVSMEDPEFTNVAFNMSFSREFLYAPVLAHYALGKAPRKWEVNMYFRYCPFCGIKAPTE